MSVNQSTESENSQIFKDDSADSSVLSGLETSVFTELALGHPLQEVAKTHKLSEITVTLLADNIVSKMGARNLRHAITMKIASDGNSIRQA